MASAADQKARMPWSVKGVTPEARDIAKDAAARDSATMGHWLSDVIRRVGAAEAAGRPLAPPSSGRKEPMPADRDMADRDMAAAELIAETDIEELVAEVAERVDRSETRLVGVLSTLEEILEQLTDRLERLETEVHPAAGPYDRD